MELYFSYNYSFNHIIIPLSIFVSINSFSKKIRDWTCIANETIILTNLQPCPFVEFEFRQIWPTFWNHEWSVCCKQKKASVCCDQSVLYLWFFSIITWNCHSSSYTVHFQPPLNCGYHWFGKGWHTTKDDSYLYSPYIILQNGDLNENICYGPNDLWNQWVNHGLNC